MTAAKADDSGATCPIPDVVIDVQRDFETDQTRMKAQQRWRHAKKKGDEDRTGICLPIKVGQIELIDDAVVRRYVENYMNAAARDMIARGYVPRKVD